MHGPTDMQLHMHGAPKRPEIISPVCYEINSQCYLWSFKPVAEDNAETDGLRAF